MAVWNFDDFEAEPADAGGRVQRLIHLAGAATSIGLVVGLGLWGYRLAMRDVNGIPVIKAIAGPMRVAPEDPGGQVAGNVGLSVNRIAAGDGTQRKPHDKIVLAPAPTALTGADVAPETRAKAQAAEAAAAQRQPAVAPAAPAAAPAAPAAAPADQTGTTTQQAQVLAPADTTATTSQAAVSVSGTSRLPGGPPVRSPAPPPRPTITAAQAMSADAAAAAAAAAAAVAAAPPVPETVDPSKLAAGTRLVQLGAFASAGDAVKEWDALQARFGDLMADKSRVVQRAESGGRAFYRLRAYGFKGDADSRRFCAALKAESATCVPVVLR